MSTFAIALFLPLTSSILFILLFFMVYKRDEYQLINYISYAKHYMILLDGVGGLVQCTYAVAVSRHNALARCLPFGYP